MIGGADSKQQSFYPLSSILYPRVVCPRANTSARNPQQRHVPAPQYKRTLVTSALPYANGNIHLGHVAGAYLPADMYTRFLRSSGEEVLHVSGSDEHGVAIEISADAEHVTPRDIIDKYHEANA